MTAVRGGIAAGWPQALSGAWRRVRLTAEVMVWRHGLLWPLAAGVALLAAVAGWSALSRLDEEAAQLQGRVVRLGQAQDARQRASAPVRTSADDELAELRRFLAGPPRNAVESAARVAEVMARHGLPWRASDYRDTLDKGTGVRRLQFQVTVEAGYPQVRALSQDLLRALPRLSLDELSMQRDGVGQPVPKVRLSLSVWSMEPAP